MKNETSEQSREREEFPEHTAAERKDFERGCEAMGFDLQRMYCAAPEPWSEYADEATGHRWGGWLAGVEWAWAQGIAPPHQPQPEPQEAAEPSEKQRKLMELADRIDYERLCLRAGLDHKHFTQEQKDRMNAGVELRRYAQIWKADRWIVIPPTGPVRFSATTLDKAYEMAKKEEARNG